MVNYMYLFNIRKLQKEYFLIIYSLLLVFFVIYRTPEWLKKMFASVTKSERNGPVFRFFMDLGDAGMTVLFIIPYILIWSNSSETYFLPLFIFEASNGLMKAAASG